jgi:hypothetical protein
MKKKLRVLKAEELKLVAGGVVVDGYFFEGQGQTSPPPPPKKP